MTIDKSSAFRKLLQQFDEKQNPTNDDGGGETAEFTVVPKEIISFTDAVTVREGTLPAYIGMHRYIGMDWIG